LPQESKRVLIKLIGISETGANILEEIGIQIGKMCVYKSYAADASETKRC